MMLRENLAFQQRLGVSVDFMSCVSYIFLMNSCGYFLQESSCFNGRSLESRDTRDYRLGGS